MVNYLPKIFDDGLVSIVDLRLVPFGNARVGPNGSIYCQVLLLSPANDTIYWDNYVRLIEIYMHFSD